MMTFFGTVFLKEINAGSKSTRFAAHLRLEDGREFILLRYGGPTFQDKSLDTLQGKSVRCEGWINEGVLFFTEIRE